MHESVTSAHGTRINLFFYENCMRDNLRSFTKLNQILSYTPIDFKIIVPIFELQRDINYNV